MAHSVRQRDTLISFFYCPHYPFFPLFFSHPMTDFSNHNFSNVAPVTKEKKVDSTHGLRWRKTKPNHNNRL